MRGPSVFVRLSSPWPIVATMVDIEVRGAGPGGSGDELPAVLVRLADDRMTARELIRHAVEEQIRELRADGARCRRVLDHHYPSSGGPGATQGAPDATGTLRPEQADPDVTEEVARAHRAFVEGAFLLLVGRRHVADLDQEVALRLGEPVLFLRRIALAGG